MELLLTLAGLLMALYAIIPRERQMELRFRVGPFEWGALLIVFLPVFFFLEYYGFFVARGWAPASEEWPMGFTPANVRPLLVLFLAVFFGLRVHRARLSRRRIGKFTELCQELLWAESYPELLSLFQRNVKEFFRIYRADYWLPALRRRLVSRVQPSFFLEDLIRVMEGPPACGLVDRIPEWLARPLIRCLPTYSSERNAAAQVVQSVLMTPRFMEAASRARPYLGIDIVRGLPGRFDQTEFMSGLLAELMANPASVLYWEIEKNRNISRGHRYDIPESNRLIHFLLKDARVAQDLGMWKPMGEFALRELDRLAADSAGDPNNQGAGDFQKRAMWRSPLYATVRLFDIMVREALYQGIEWHMWLYYFPPLVERMVRNCEPCGPLVDLEETFPVRYNHLIYEAVSAIRDWVKAADDIPEGQGNVTLRSVQADPGNGNIPKSSVLALGQCSRHVLVSEKFEEKFKDWVMNGTFELYFTLRQSAKLSRYADVLGSSLRHGGLAPWTADPMYLTSLHGSFGRLRHEHGITHQSEHVSDLARAIGVRTEGAAR